jgi:uncharacterized membrane protein
MELDDLKNTWENMSDQVKKQQNLNPKMINEMTKKKFESNLKKIAYPETIGVIICLAGAIFIGLNFSILDTIFLKSVGIVSVILLLALSVISLISVRQLNMRADVNKSYSETLKEFAVQKIRFYKFQKINVTLSYLLLVTTIVLFSKFFGSKDITNSKYFWIFSFSFGYIFLSFYAKWVSKYYHNSLRQTEELLKELSNSV